MNHSAVVQKIPIFSTVSESLASKIGEKLVQKNFKKDEEIAKEGVPQEHLIYIESGKLARVKGGKEIDTLGAGEISGMLHLVEHAPSFASLVGKEDGVVWMLSVKDFEELMDLKAESLSTHLVQFLAKELRTNSKVLRSLQTQRDPRFSIAFFDTKTYDQASFTNHNSKRGDQFYIRYFNERLSEASVRLAAGFDAVCIFVNDQAPAKVIEQLSEMGISLILLRCAGYNNVDLNACYANDITVVRVPAYSPYAVAEHAVGLMLTLNRHIHKAYNRTKEGNFALNGLMGFDMYGKTVGVVGTGKIGRVLVSIVRGFGCKVLCYDKYPSSELKGVEGVRYVDQLDELLGVSDIISLHCPLTPETKHLINADSIAKMKEGVMLINTSRGGLVDSSALIAGLKSKRIASAGLDVVEEEGDYVFEDHSGDAIADNMLSRLLSFPNVIITGHQAFFTQEAVATIATTTLDNALLFHKDGKKGKAHPNFVVPEY